MNKKKFIIAFVAFLVIACGVLVFVNRNRYHSKAVLTEVCKDCTYVDQITRNDRYERLTTPKSPDPSPLEKVTNWYKYNYSSYQFNQMKTIDPDKALLLFYESGNYLTVKLSFKMGLVDSVEIRDRGSSQSALKLKSRLSDKFPGLSCEIITFP